MNLLSNQAWAVKAAHAWLDRKFKNHWLRMQYSSGVNRPYNHPTL